MARSAERILSFVAPRTDRGPVAGSIGDLGQVHYQEDYLPLTFLPDDVTPEPMIETEKLL